jgi:hypothetical protein
MKNKILRKRKALVPRKQNKKKECFTSTQAKGKRLLKDLFDEIDPMPGFKSFTRTML